MKNRKIAILGDSPLEYDARVQRIIKSFEGKGYSVDVFLPNVNSSELNFSTDKVKIIYYKLNNSWLNRNILFWRKFSNVIELVNSKKIKSNPFTLFFLIHFSS